MYTIGQVSELFDLPVSTLRYYDKEGLFPKLERKSGIRHFSKYEIDSLYVIECLKKSGMELKDIKQFMQWCMEGPATYSKRKELFEMRTSALEAQIHELEKSLAMAKFKCWYYEQAMKDGNEEHIHAMIPDKLPPEILELYRLAHE